MSTTRAVSKSSAAHSPYQRLFMLPGAKAFCLSGAVARLPISMMSLGIVLALNHLYDNWTIAGTMSAAYVLAMSCVTPFYARAFDRFGQARVGRRRADRGHARLRLRGVGARADSAAVRFGHHHGSDAVLIRRIGPNPLVLCVARCGRWRTAAQHGLRHGSRH